MTYASPHARMATRNTAFAAIAAGALAWLSGPVYANDSEAEIGLDGIVVLKDSAAIALESEDLYISADRVRVQYRFRNPTSADITTTIAFPMPRQPRGIMARMIDEGAAQDFSDFGFATRVDGLPVRLNMIERAVVGERDVTARIGELGLPLYWPSRPGLMDDLNETQRGLLKAEGLLAEDVEYYDGELVPAWDLATYFVREQLFPAGKAITVEHEYAPMTGGSVGGALYKKTREDAPEILADYKDAYCIDDHFIAGFDRRLASSKPGFSGYYSETWIGYVLTSGANWKGSIGDFRLVVDKGSTENLVSFCMDGVKKIAPTRFEVRKRDFVPKKDLFILITEFAQYEE